MVFMNTIKKMSLTSIFTLILILVMTCSVFAAEGQNGKYLYGDAITNMSGSDAAAYVNSATGDKNVTVKLIIEAGDNCDPEKWSDNVTPGSHFKQVFTKTISRNNSKGVTVKDLLDSVNNDGLRINYNDPNPGNPYYLLSIEKNNLLWKSGVLGFGGWVFRVNDKFPIQRTSDNKGYEGTSVDQTVLHDGDIVHFFYDFPAQFTPTDDNIGAYNLRGIFKGRQGNKTKIQIQGHRTWIDQSNPTGMIMNVYNYFDITASNMANNTAVFASQLNIMGVAPKLTASDGTVYSGKMDVTGMATFTDIPKGTYTFSTEQQRLYFDEDEDAFSEYSGVFMSAPGAFHLIEIN